MKSKEVPKEDVFVKGTKNIFPVDTELDFTTLMVATEGKTKKGKGITTLGFIVKAAWLDEDGQLIVFVEPDKQIAGKKYNKYGEEITKADE